MDPHKLVLLIHTLKHLRFRQLYFRGYYLIRNRFFRKDYKKPLNKDIEPLKWKDSFLYTDSFKKENTFEFLNVSNTFNAQIDWNHNVLGKLWTYNLNYFDFLNQATITSEEGVALIQDYIEKDSVLIDGKEPYPISLRGINWIKFLSKHSISNPEINQTLFNHYQTLLKNIEYHLLGNHLLENGFSLFFGAYYFKDEFLYAKAKQILMEELNEQILKDGAHFELSPMYHQILLHRVLDCIRLLQLNSWKEDGLLGQFLKEKALKMLSWLQEASFSNGSIPMVNDSAYGIAPTSTQLFDYAKNLCLKWPKGELSDSGYRKFSQPTYELFVDVGNIGPTYQPGHAHSDTFSFELYLHKQPFIVDVGTSTYEKDQKRMSERQTYSHNTVMVNRRDQTQVWSVFRVANRAKIINLKENPNMVLATHNGYKSIGIVHERSFSAVENIIIHDKILSKKEKALISEAFFHVHPSIKNININRNQVLFKDIDVSFNFEGHVNQIKLEEYQYSLGFNRTESAQKICVSFSKELITNIVL